MLDAEAPPEEIRDAQDEQSSNAALNQMQQAQARLDASEHRVR